MEKFSTNIAYGVGMFTAFVGSWTLEGVAIVVGIVCTIGTFLVNWYYKEQERRRAK